MDREFQALIGALQTKFNRKTKEQSQKFDSEMKSIVRKTVDVLAAKVGDYEGELYVCMLNVSKIISCLRTKQLDTLKKELDDISEKRNGQVEEFQQHYSSMKVCIKPHPIFF